jgi:hypothetical protein
MMKLKMQAWVKDTNHRVVVPFESQTVRHDMEPGETRRADRRRQHMMTWLRLFHVDTCQAGIKSLSYKINLTEP